MSDDTIAITGGRDPAQSHGSVNPPVDRASTRIFPTLDAIETAHGTGRLSAFLGSRTPDQLADAIAALEGPDARALVTSTGMSAITVTLLANLSAGDHLLAPDTIFGPVRTLAGDLLARMGIETSYYHPATDAEGLRAEMRPNTKMVLVECPGSDTFEMQDLRAIVRIAHEAGALVAADNTWATPYFCKPLALGVDFSISAATKYLAGHSDTVIGTVATSAEHIERLQATARQMGDGAGADDAWLTLRGLRTLPIRLKRHEETALMLARRLEAHPKVRQVLHPALDSFPGHDLWKRDFTGSTGLFSVVLDPLTRVQLETFLAALTHFQLGYSWGGYESLILPIAPAPARSHTPMPEGTLLRLHAGLEDPQDLAADLDAALLTLGPAA
ncbi:MAG: cystathionine beta-lyase [Pseudomonadota bacterium]|nr:cystathionine beta-lyase [Pseudomonadota bacterium]